MITLLCATGTMNVIVGFLLALAVWLDCRRFPGELPALLFDPPNVNMAEAAS
jgi:hypothetical protein